jgi:hypothetical protein
MRIRHLIFCAVIVGATLVSAQGAPFTSIPSPAPAGAAQPQLTVSSRGVLLSWIERAGKTATLKFAERTASGWTPAKTAGSGDDWFVNWADVPSVLRLADGTLAAHWLQKSGADTYAYDIRLAYSKDDGKSWSKSFIPHTDGTKTEHGFASLVQMPGAGLGLVFLDGRAMKPGGHDMAGHDAGAMSLRFASFDKAWKQTAEMAIDNKVCECCPTTAAVTSEGVIAAYRNRSDTEIRDIYVSRLVNGKWTDGVPVHADNWQINACPVNGPSLSADGRNVVLSWFTTKQSKGEAFLAFSSDAGRTFGTPVRLDDAGSLGRVDVELLADGDALTTWIEYPGDKAEFRGRKVSKTGVKSAAFTIATIATSRAAGYPRAARFGNELVFAWIESAGGVSHIKTAAGAAK